nr:MAG TPA: hypothetical protein [Caudoviricetes sp.]
MIAPTHAPSTAAAAGITTLHHMSIDSPSRSQQNALCSGKYYHMEYRQIKPLRAASHN